MPGENPRVDRRVALANDRYCEETIALKRRVESDSMSLARRLHEVELNRKWEGGYESYEDFLEAAKIARSVASRMVTVWRALVIGQRVEPEAIAEAGGPLLAYEVIAFCVRRRETDAWLERVRLLRRADLRKEIAEARAGGVETRRCRHRRIEKVQFTRCLDCPETWRDGDDYGRGAGHE